MDKQTLIEQLLPVYIKTYSRFTPDEIRAKLQNIGTNHLQTIYDEQVQSGNIKPLQNAPVPDAAKQERERLQREYLEHEKQQLLEQVKQLQAGLITDALFRPHAIFPDKVLVDTQATRQQLVSLINPGEEIRNPVAWLKKVLSDSPQLVQTLPFEDYVYVSPAERKQQDQEALAYDKQVFHEFCRDTEKCAERDSNFNVCRSVLGSPLGRHALDTGVVLLPEGVFLIGDDGQTHKLVSASTTDQQNWAKERSDLDRANLKRMSRENDFAGLREHDRRRRELHGQDEAQLHLQYSLLKTYGERESTMPELPATWNGQPLTREFLWKAKPDVLREIMRKHGRCQMDARLFQLPADFFTNYASKLRDIEERLGYKRADFTRPELLAETLNQNRNR